MTELQTFLVRLVRSSGRTQASLARQAELTEKHLSQMMTGRVEGSLSAWQALLDAAGVRLSQGGESDVPARLDSPTQVR